jgi:hypothetical protein
MWEIVGSANVFNPTINSFQVYLDKVRLESRQRAVREPLESR